MNIILDLSEYVIPKLARSNVDLNDSSDKIIKVTIEPEEFDKRVARANKILGYEPIHTKLNNT